MTTDSFINHGKHGSTSFVGKDSVACFRAFTIASGLKLYATTGMKPSRMWTPSAMLKAASEITGKKYKRGQYLQAAEDVTKWAETMRDALPHVDESAT